jgi:hypothetical protein
VPVALNKSAVTVQKASKGDVLRQCVKEAAADKNIKL